MLRDFNAIGFDVDFCLAKFNVKELMKPVVQAMLDDLQAAHPDNYPILIRHYEFEKHSGVFLNNAVWDIEKGTILKLGEN
jgi:hypothetical protein